jgi:hypothetical protein
VIVERRKGVFEFRGKNEVSWRQKWLYYSHCAGMSASLSSAFLLLGHQGHDGLEPAALLLWSHYAGGYVTCRALGLALEGRGRDQAPFANLVSPSSDILAALHSAMSARPIGQTGAADGSDTGQSLNWSVCTGMKSSTLCRPRAISLGASFTMARAR